MAIEFRCPNGHRLSCADDKVGRSGKCPKCGAAFTVPAPGEASPGPSDSGVGHPELSDSGQYFTEHETSDEAADEPPAVEEPLADFTSAPPPADERIVFLCPNGHKLNCPASMQGRPGKCPHCGATFLVPEHDGGSEDEFADLTIAEAPEGETIEEAPPEVNGFGRRQDEADGEFPFDFSQLGGAAAGETSAGPGMAQLFAQLWPHRKTGGVVELYLKGGQVVAPDWYAPRHSQETCGMFAVANKDGSYTLTAVQWDSIERIAVRGIRDLPAGMFEDD